MAANPFFADAAAEASVNALAALCNGGTLNVYAGSQPADANTAVTSQTLLATATFGATAFGNAVASGSAPSRVAVATAAGITPGAAVASGTAAWFRVLTGASAAVFDGSVGTSGADLNLSGTVITAGQAVAISSFTITQPE